MYIYIYIYIYVLCIYIKQEIHLTLSKDDYKMRCKYKNINPRSWQKQLKPSFIKTLFENKSVNFQKFLSVFKLSNVFLNVFTFK